MLDFVKKTLTGIIRQITQLCGKVAVALMCLFLSPF